MGSLTNTAEAAVLNALLGGSPLGAPASMFVALFSTDPADEAGGTEFSAASYARVEVVNNAANFPAASGTNPTTKTNGTDILFPVAQENWGTANFWAFFDAATLGTMWFHGAITEPKAFDAGDIAKLPADSLTITAD